MLNTSSNANGSGRLEEIIKTISEARKALQEWQDKKTEALIQFDSLAYDVRMLEEEKAGMAQSTQNHQEQIRDQDRVYQTHIDAMTDQNQELKLENEQLKIQLQATTEVLVRLQNESSYEIDFLKMKIAAQAGEYEAQQSLNVARAKSDMEIKIADLQYQFKNQLQTMTEQLQSIHTQKSELETKAQQLEQDLQAIRAQMLNALRVHEAIATEKVTVTPVPNPIPNVNPASIPVSTPSRNVTPSNSSSNASSASAQEGKLRAMEVENPSFVQDYLRRLGY